MKGKNSQVKNYVIGRKYHCNWAYSRGMVWRLVSFNVELNEAFIVTPKTGKHIKTQLNSLRNINKYIGE